MTRLIVIEILVGTLMTTRRLNAYYSFLKLLKDNLGKEL